MVTAVRQGVLTMLSHAWETLVTMRQRGGVELTAIEWQKGYVKALEEILDLEGVSLRRYPRRPTAIPAEIARILPETGAPGPRGDGTIVDLSVAGCGLATAMELSVNETIALSFRLPESSTPVTLDGWVRRAQLLNGKFRVGVEFKSAPRVLRGFN